MTTGRRSFAAGFSVLAHIAVLWAMLPHAAKPQVETGIMSASLVDGAGLLPSFPTSVSTPAASQLASKPEEPRVRPDIEPLPVADAISPVDATAQPVEITPAVAVNVALAAEAAALASKGDPCALGEWLQEALQNDPSVQNALSAVPRSARSVANAVMLWNGQWAEPAASAAKGMSEIRALVITGVRAAPIICQTQQITGPVLITVGDQASATVLAVGSGKWRWQDLLAGSTQIE